MGRCPECGAGWVETSFRKNFRTESHVLVVEFKIAYCPACGWLTVRDWDSWMIKDRHWLGDYVSESSATG